MQRAPVNGSQNVAATDYRDLVCANHADRALGSGRAEARTLPAMGDGQAIGKTRDGRAKLAEPRPWASKPTRQGRRAASKSFRGSRRTAVDGEHYEVPLLLIGELQCVPCFE